MPSCGLVPIQWSEVKFSFAIEPACVWKMLRVKSGIITEHRETYRWALQLRLLSVSEVGTGIWNQISLPQKRQRNKTEKLSNSSNCVLVNACTSPYYLSAAFLGTQARQPASIDVFEEFGISSNIWFHPVAVCLTCHFVVRVRCRWFTNSPLQFVSCRRWLRHLQSMGMTVFECTFLARKPNASYEGPRPSSLQLFISKTSTCLGQILTKKPLLRHQTKICILSLKLNNYHSYHTRYFCMSDASSRCCY